MWVLLQGSELRVFSFDVFSTRELARRYAEFHGKIVLYDEDEWPDDMRFVYLTRMRCDPKI